MEKPKFDIESVPKYIRPYFEAKENGTLPQYYLGRFRYFRDDFLDDLPDEDVGNLVTLDKKGDFARDNYKCSGNYTFNLSGLLQKAVSDGVVSLPELIGSIEQFIFHDFEYHHGKFTTPQEIDMINQILADVIQSLEK